MEGMTKFFPVCVKGSTWDEGRKTKIVQILISYDQNYIRSIQFVYVVDGQVVRSKVHGNYGIHDQMEKFAAVGFDYPREYLVSVSGFHNHYVGLVSIAFETNKRKYGPFGEAYDIDFENKSEFSYYFTPKSSFGGFHGTVSEAKFSIGVYVRPIASLDEIDFTNE